MGRCAGLAGRENSIGRWVGGLMPMQEGAQDSQLIQAGRVSGFVLFHNWQHQEQNGALVLSFLVSIIPVLVLPHCDNSAGHLPPSLRAS